MLRMLRDRLEPATVESADVLGWATDAIEAQAFGFLAARGLKGLPLSYPATTGVPMPMTFGNRADPDLTVRGWNGQRANSRQLLLVDESRAIGQSIDKSFAASPARKAGKLIGRVDHRHHNPLLGNRHAAAWMKTLSVAVPSGHKGIVM